MTESCKTLKVTQIGGFAGDVTLPPLVDLDRDALDANGRHVLDEACRQLSAAADRAGAAPDVGADLASYVIEMSSEEGAAPRRFALPGPSASDMSAADADISRIIAPLVTLSEAKN